MSLALPKKPSPQEAPRALGGWGFAPVAAAKSVSVKREKPLDNAGDRTPKVKVKVDPRLVAEARELRDRWMEELNHCAPMLGEGKYDVGRVMMGGGNVGGSKGVGDAKALPADSRTSPQAA